MEQVWQEMWMYQAGFIDYLWHIESASVQKHTFSHILFNLYLKENDQVSAVSPVYNWSHFDQVGGI